MSDRTGIQWADATWNPTLGCSRVSAGCANCYAERLAIRFSFPPTVRRNSRGVQVDSRVRGPFAGLVRTTVDGPRWTGQVRFAPERLELPLRWRKPRTVFVDSMSDLFHPAVTRDQVAATFGVMALARQHRFIVLTKRSERMRDLLRELTLAEAWSAMSRLDPHYARRPLLASALADLPGWPLHNVVLGASVEDQRTASSRIPVLLSTPASMRCVSYEPALAPVRFPYLDRHATQEDDSCAAWCRPCRERRAVGIATDARLDGIIVGGESGPGSRPCDVSWIRSTIEQCRAAGSRCFVKQLGSSAWLPPVLAPDGTVVSAARRLDLLDRAGGDPNEWPEDLRIREPL